MFHNPFLEIYQPFSYRSKEKGIPTFGRNAFVLSTSASIPQSAEKGK